MFGSKLTATGGPLQLQSHQQFQTHLPNYHIDLVVKWLAPNGLLRTSKIVYLKRATAEMIVHDEFRREQIEFDFIVEVVFNGTTYRNTDRYDLFHRSDSPIVVPPQERVACALKAAIFAEWDLSISGPVSIPFMQWGLDTLKAEYAEEIEVQQGVILFKGENHRLRWSFFVTDVTTMQPVK